jgi:hypothetical protein
MTRVAPMRANNTQMMHSCRSSSSSVCMVRLLLDGLMIEGERWWEGIGGYCPAESGTTQSEPSQTGASLFRLREATSGETNSRNVIGLADEMLVARAVAP